MTPIHAAKFDLEKLDFFAPNHGKFYEIGVILENFLRATIKAWQGTGFARQNDSFGLVVADPGRGGEYHEIWDKPSELIAGGLVIGWGHDWRRYAANALCKIRATAREGLDTRDIFENSPELFQLNPSKSNASPFIWGDFPHGGAVIDGNGTNQLLVGVSGLTATEDHRTARLTADFINERLSTKTSG